MTDDELRDLIPLIALDALDPAERDAGESAIAAHPEMQAELDDLRAIVAQLAESESTQPPAALKATILAAIAAVDQASPVDAGSSAGGQPTVAQPHRTSGPRPARSRFVAKSRRWTVGISVAAAVAVTVIGGAVWIGADSPSDSERVAAILDLPDVESLELLGAMEGVRIVHAPSSAAAVLVADGMPDPGADRAYQLWFVHDGVASPSSVFRPDPAGHVEVLLEDFAPSGAVIAVTIEPDDGSNAPTSPTLVRSPA